MSLTNRPTDDAGSFYTKVRDLLEYVDDDIFNSATDTLELNRDVSQPPCLALARAARFPYRHEISLTLSMSLSLQKTVIEIGRPGYALRERRYVERITWAPVGSPSYPPGHTASSSYQTSPPIGDQRSQHGKSRTSCMCGPILMH